jgi:hypothetical protein
MWALHPFFSTQQLSLSNDPLTMESLRYGALYSVDCEAFRMSEYGIVKIFNYARRIVERIFENTKLYPMGKMLN